MQAKEKARWGLRLASFSSFKIGSCFIVQLLGWPGDLSLPCCCLILCWGVCTLLAFCSPDLWSCWPSLKIYSGQWPDCVVKLRHWQDLWSGNTGGAQAWFAGATTVHGPYQGDCITGVTLAIWVGTVKKSKPSQYLSSSDWPEIGREEDEHICWWPGRGQGLGEYLQAGCKFYQQGEATHYIEYLDCGQCNGGDAGWVSILLEQAFSAETKAILKMNADPDQLTYQAESSFLVQVQVHLCW